MCSPQKVVIPPGMVDPSEPAIVEIPAELKDVDTVYATPKRSDLSGSGDISVFCPQDCSTFKKRCGADTVYDITTNYSRIAHHHEPTNWSLRNMVWRRSELESLDKSDWEPPPSPEHKYQNWPPPKEHTYQNWPPPKEHTYENWPPPKEHTYENWPPPPGSPCPGAQALEPTDDSFSLSVSRLLDQEAAEPTYDEVFEPTYDEVFEPTYDEVFEPTYETINPDLDKREMDKCLGALKGYQRARRGLFGMAANMATAEEVVRAKGKKLWSNVKKAKSKYFPKAKGFYDPGAALDQAMMESPESSPAKGSYSPYNVAIGKSRCPPKEVVNIPTPPKRRDMGKLKKYYQGHEDCNCK